MSRAAPHLALLGLLSLTLAACFGGDPTERVAAAADATTAAGTARTEMTVVVEPADGDGAELMLQAEGEVDFAADQASMALRVPGIPEPLVTVVDGATTYTRIPEEFAEEGAGWIRRDGPGGGLGLGPGVGVASEHPTRMLAAISGASDDVTELGGGEIHDTDVDGFEVTVRGRGLARGDDVPPAFAELAIPVEAWLDADDRVHELVASFDLATVMEAARARSEDRAPGATLDDAPATEGTLRLLFELSDFGTETDIRVPADDDVIEADAVDEQLLQGG